MGVKMGENHRTEKDALGPVLVPSDRLWGAQTERSRENFPIGVDRYRWGRPVVRALGVLKKCCALANGELGQLPPEKVELIVRAAQEVIDGRESMQTCGDWFASGSIRAHGGGRGWCRSWCGG